MNFTCITSLLKKKVKIINDGLQTPPPHRSRHERRVCVVSEPLLMVLMAFGHHSSKVIIKPFFVGKNGYFKPNRCLFA